jgi:hypothetical protein
MAQLSAAERLELRASIGRSISNERLELAGVTKADLLAAVVAVDTFFDTNGNAINNAIPEPCRSALSARQKAMLVTAIIRARYGN